MARHRNQHTARDAATPPVAALDDRACAGANPEIFFSTKGADETLALDLCFACPHRQACLDWALETEQRFGILGGTTPDQRDRILRGAA